MKRLNPELKKNFFGTFLTKDHGAIGDLGYDVGNARTTQSVLASITSEFGEVVATEISMVMDVLGLGDAYWEYSDLFGFVTLTALMHESGSVLDIVVTKQKILDVRFGDINEADDNIMLPLFKDIGYQSVNPGSVMRKVNYLGKIFELKPRVGCKVYKRVGDANITFVALRPRPAIDL